MRKLATAATAFSAAIFAANYILETQWLIVPAVLLAALGAALAARHERWLKPAAIALIFFSLGLLNYYVQYRLTAERAQEAAGQTVEVTLRLTSYPVDYGDYCRAEGVPTGGELPSLRAVIYDSSGSIAGAIPGQTLSFTGKISSADTLYGEASDVYNAKDIYFKINTVGEAEISGTWDLRSAPAYLSHALGKIADKVFPEDVRPFMKSLLMGDRKDYFDDEATELAVSRAGLSHVMAVSGMHVAFLVGLLRLLLGSTRRSSVICMALVWLFTLITGAGPSAVRAAVMQSLLLTAPIVYRENDPPTSLSAALALILLKNPLAAKSVSLQLSFAAMAGIVCFAERINAALAERLPEKLRGRAADYVLGSVASSLAVSVTTVPLTALHFGTIQILAAVSNLLALWAVSFCFCAGWAACALCAVPLLGQAAAWLCAWLARYILLVAKLVSAVPFAVLYTRTAGAWLWLVFCYAAFAVFLRLRLPKWLKLSAPAALCALSLAVLLALVKSEYENGDGTISVIDVGQGQSIAAFKGDSTVVIDCGRSYGDDAGERTGEYLISCGRDKIDLLLLTHLHEDHANGVPMLMELLRIDTLIMPEDADRDDALCREILERAEEKGTEVVFLGRDAQIDCGGISMEIYKYPGDEDENERCLMARLTLDGYDMLVTGDSSAEIESLLMRQHDVTGTELLIVGHHGSKYSSGEEFLRRVGAQTAVISTGYNTYGHPAEETLERLADCGYNVYRTDEDGTVELRIGAE